MPLFRALAKNMAARYAQWKLPYGFPTEAKTLYVICGIKVNILRVLLDPRGFDLPQRFDFPIRLVKSLWNQGSSSIFLG